MRKLKIHAPSKYLLCFPYSFFYICMYLSPLFMLNGMENLSQLLKIVTEIFKPLSPKITSNLLLDHTLFVFWMKLAIQPCAKLFVIMNPLIQSKLLERSNSTMLVFGRDHLSAAIWLLSLSLVPLYFGPIVTSRAFKLYY